MKNEETSYEQNLARLIQASCGPETRVISSAGRKLRQRLFSECRLRSTLDEFPKIALGILIGILLLLVTGGFFGRLEP